MAKIRKKFKARALRKQGKSIREIAKTLDVSKGSVSVWCRDITLSSQQIKKLAENKRRGGAKGRLKAAEKKKKQRIEQERRLKKEGMQEVGELSKRDLFILGVGIYWSEGYTYPGGHQVAFTNSDSRMVLLMLRWFEKICCIPKDRISLAVRVNQIHKDRVKEIEKYWSNLTGIPLSQFNKTVLIQSEAKKTYPNRSNYYGTLRMTVRKSTKLRRKLKGWIAGLVKKR